MRLSVLMPLEDARGDIVEHLRTWTHGQSLAREQYQLVLAAPFRHSELAPELTALLAPHDVLLELPGAHVIELWNAAAGRASAPWIVLTEAHCLAEPDCLEIVLRFVEENPGVDAALLEEKHPDGGRVSSLNSRWFNQVNDAWGARDWPQLKLLGTVMPRALFERHGRLDARFGVFSIALLSAQLAVEGADIRRIERASVVHILEEDLAEGHEKSVDYAYGECTARSAFPVAFCERYFGHAPLWANRARFDAKLARRTATCIGRELGRAALTRRADMPWLARTLATWLPPALGGTAPAQLAAAAAYGASTLATEHFPLRPHRRWAAYNLAQNLAVRRAQLDWTRDHRDDPGAPPLEAGLHEMHELEQDVLVGSHGLETHGARSFRWTEPATVVRLAPSAGRRTLALDTGGLRGSPLGFVAAAYGDGRRLELREDGARLLVDVPPSTNVSELTVLTRPFQLPAGSPDRRALGLPVFALELG